MATEARPETIDLELGDFKLPSPKEWSGDDRTSIISGSFRRIWDGAEELRGLSSDSFKAGGIPASELWMLLIVRMITRLAEPPLDFDGDDAMKDDSKDVVHDFYSRQDQLRQSLCDYIMADFPSR
jgi:symplekin